MDFNPRPRKEGDGAIVLDVSKVDISIHALVKRATAQQYEAQLTRIISIHALVKRATYHTVFTKAQYNISIHALVKRATAVNMVVTIFSNFNPRPRKEGDCWKNCE